MNPRRHNHIEVALDILNRSKTVELLRDDPYLLFLFKKTERVVAGLYIITSSFPDTESLKWGIRESGTHLLKHALSFQEKNGTNSREFLSSTLTATAYLLSLLDLASIANLMSQMNFALLRKEIEGLLGILEGRWRTQSQAVSTPLLGEDFFGISKNLFSETEERKGKISTPQLEQTSPLSEKNIQLRALGDFERLRKTQKDIHKGQMDNVLDSRLRVSRLRTETPPSKKSAPRPLSHQLREVRKQSILSILRERDTAMIKDFSAIIRDCSEKTIQRLLIELVAEGVLKKVGSRRWSRYAVAAERGENV